MQHLSNVSRSFAEHVRLEAQAVHLSAMMNDHVLHAPVKDGPGKRMLDVGCGTGIITDLIAERYPNAQVFGVDLSKVPKLRPHEQNVRFLRGNVTAQKPTAWEVDDGGEKLSQEAGCFDYIFSRLLILGMHDWPEYIRAEFDLVRPGGWVEVHDLDWDWFDRNDNVISKDWGWLHTLIDTLEKEKRFNLHCGSGAQKWMKEAGFIDVQVFEYRWPFGGQSEPTIEMREFGEYSAVGMPTMLHHMIEKTMADDPLSGERSQMIDRMRAEMRWSLLPEKGKHQTFYVSQAEDQKDK